MNGDDESEAKAFAESGPLNVIVDVFSGDGLLDHFLDAEGGVSAAVEVSRSGMQCSIAGPPAFEFSDLF